MATDGNKRFDSAVSRPASRNWRSIADEIEAKFMRLLPPATYPSEWSFGITMDYRDWHEVVKALRAAPRSERGERITFLEESLRMAKAVLSVYASNNRHGPQAAQETLAALSAKKLSFDAPSER